MFFALLKNQFFGKFAFEMTQLLFRGREGVGKNVHKMYEGGGGLLETYESVQGREEVKKYQIWAYVLLEWPPVKPIYYSTNEAS